MSRGAGCLVLGRTASRARLGEMRCTRRSLQSHLETGTCSGGVRCHVWRGRGRKHLRREAQGRGGSLLLTPLQGGSKVGCPALPSSAVRGGDPPGPHRSSQAPDPSHHLSLGSIHLPGQNRTCPESLPSHPRVHPTASTLCLGTATLPPGVTSSRSLPRPPGYPDPPSALSRLFH